MALCSYLQLAKNCQGEKVKVVDVANAFIITPNYHLAIEMIDD